MLKRETVDKKVKTSFGLTEKNGRWINNDNRLEAVFDENKDYVSLLFFENGFLESEHKIFYKDCVSNLVVSMEDTPNASSLLSL